MRRIYIGGPKHGQVMDFDHAIVKVAQPRILGLDIQLTGPGDKLFSGALVNNDVIYEQRRFHLKGTRRYMTYMVAQSLSNEEAEKLVDAYESQSDAIPIPIR